MAAMAQLSSRQRRFLQDQGYLVVRSLLDQAVLTRIGERLQELVRQTVAAWADEPSLDTTEGCVVAEFDVTRPDFAPCHEHPLLADAATTVLGDRWHVRNLDLRAPIPGCGAQGLHPDYAERRTEGPSPATAGRSGSYPARTADPSRRSTPSTGTRPGWARIRMR